MIKQVVGRALLATTLAGGAMLPLTSVAAEREFLMDTRNDHAFIQFKISHLGFSYILGEFNDFQGSFYLDMDNLEKSRVAVEIDVESIDTDNAERDKVLKGAQFFNTDKNRWAKFKSTKVVKEGDKSAKVTGDLTLNGITKPITLDVDHINGGYDLFGFSRQGFEATTRVRLEDFGLMYFVKMYPVPEAEYADLYITVEGVEQDPKTGKTLQRKDKPKAAKP